jgi:hypothetical protein
MSPPYVLVKSGYQPRLGIATADAAAGRRGAQAASRSTLTDIPRIVAAVGTCSTQLARSATKIIKWLIILAAKSPDWLPRNAETHHWACIRAQ